MVFQAREKRFSPSCHGQNLSELTFVIVACLVHLQYTALWEPKHPYPTIRKYIVKVVFGIGPPMTSINFSYDEALH